MRWRSEAGKNDLYVPTVRIVGTEEQVRAWLAQRGHDGALINQAFRVGDQATPRYKQAVKEASPQPLPKQARAAPVSRPLHSPLREVRQFNARIAIDQPIKLRNHRNEEKTSPCKSRLLKRVRADDGGDEASDTAAEAKHIAALKKRMDVLPTHRVLDISTYDPSTGLGARTINRPPARDLTRRGVPDLPLVSRSGASLRLLLPLLGRADLVEKVTWN